MYVSDCYHDKVPRPKCPPPVRSTCLIKVTFNEIQIVNKMKTYLYNKATKVTMLC